MNLRVFYLTRRGLSDGYVCTGGIIFGFAQCSCKQLYFLLLHKNENGSNVATKKEIPPRLWAFFLLLS